MEFLCAKCQKTYPIGGLQYKCECGGLFSLKKAPGERVPITVSLGEVVTPIIKRCFGGVEVNLKLDYFMPTGSFKDRGAFILINAIKAAGITEVVEDSSGNAGASIAGYCAAAGIKCNIYIPESTSPGKIKQLSAYQANVVKVPGSRDDTARAILAAAETTYYASHVYNPLFFEGTKSIAYEIYEQVGIPDYVVAPVGNGTMLLGLYLGFKELGRLPRLLAVQSVSCAPVYRKFHGLAPAPASSTVAEGIAVPTPMRIDEIIAAIREADGDIITVTDDEVVAAHEQLGAMGIYAEATASAVVVGVQRYFKPEEAHGLNIVVPLTGTGLKK
ncbi:Pyridoxal-5'-phosphate-dependent enzyme, beta subunit [Thermosinus carboxydivorans Nor1]|uniref:Pyridoxal-5'-phosphate-dependent enzyme, beta subunit n=1 Tax=Thermosinus carboxydivorans Nor1 TaxID=401526 RepID=A1HTF2_9FIRM|nr:pyridoxal-phosphate dependent enzyme [Thermosinus carboxydivorans]EAX46701.1 Pyridoxal-5'-phosphate-dependent enzyme, beta subunit [Thermosinus carboxydivorans Nor1]